MLQITKFTCENLEKNCVTDKKHPAFSYQLASDLEGTFVEQAKLTVNGWTLETRDQIALEYQGSSLQPFTEYEAELMVVDNHGQTATARMTFETGRLARPWQADWITDGSYRFVEKRISPKPMTFHKAFSIKKPVRSAKIYATALGIYTIFVNEQRAGQDYFAPGFTSYKTNLQYQVYDVTHQLSDENHIHVTVAGGWAVGSFIYTRKNRITADRQALLMELHVTYEDGEQEVIVSDESWSVTTEGPWEMADFYDGESYNATKELHSLSFHAASKETVSIHPCISSTYGSLVKAHEVFYPQTIRQEAGEIIYDFGQNFAGLVQLTVRGKKGQQITIRHAEILHPDGRLNTTFLRTAKATLTYTCREGLQTYRPEFTYMGFRYISVSGIEVEDIETISAIALYSDIEETGSFESSNSQLNQLQSNIVWSSKSNFVDIPTDCPQRDERMGWTGDIAVFAPTATYLFDMSRFLDKWLTDVKNEQLPTGGIPNTVPVQGFGFPVTMPTMAIDFWGDACILVPWAQYQARGDKRILARYYPMMKKYVDACKFWAGLGSFGLHRYIWHTHHSLHFGDWVAPDVPQMSQWQKRSKYTATASLKNTSQLVAEIARLLGFEKDAKYYQQISQKTAQAYEELLTTNGRLKEEFQTGYVLPIYYDLLSESAKKIAVERLVSMVKENGYKIGTGFPGTPYILFALADNGYEEIAYKMLLNDTCPSWLYEVKMGATTIWERWDGLDENGQCPIGDDGTDQMISYNHYASGAVGDFLYRRIAGLEPLEAGYRRFKVAPLIGGGLTEVKARYASAYGEIAVHWMVEDNGIRLLLQVPVGTQAEVSLNSYERQVYGSGKYEIRWEKSV
ncbi:family 78 glycoside hydrolase catalytic domain [Streptococcus sp. ZJ93]|uniref:alpha-L-rhamnosidase n=1 Tax=Streptococcus handemini TaxID=3161188 RepID=UPI0034D3FDAA